MTAAVEIIGVQKRFGEIVALEQVDLTIHEREFVSLLGASGCGKSTLLRIIAGFEFPSSGRVKIADEDVTSWPPHRRATNIVFQRGALFPHMSVFDNIAYSLKLRKWSKKRIADKVEEMLTLVQLEKFAHRDPSELSGGQSQRVALARALAAEPSVLLLDEPMSALDQKLRQQMQLELRVIQRKLGATFVFVTHDQTEALVMSDRIAIMNRGRIIQLGTPRDIYTRPTSVFASESIGPTNLLRGTVVSTEGSTVTVAIGNGHRLMIESSATFAMGTAAVLSVRPEAIRIHRVGGAAPATKGVSGTITEIVYLGSSIRIGSVTAADETIWADLRDEEAEGLQIGLKVTLSWPPSAVQIWEEGGK